ncbi:hypothetical protein BAE46_10670 [Glaciecola punicea]|uniref:extracellular catalytic domain type 2 short-chain-length polyhydroxyalkanoate depolymerase n=1 Tax=Glaciecola punicea TaxID=56804 RepID=UPI0008730DAF|nr:PHB depolymerase family esterase [Glaciecola punicea]OFA30666.1 hypothetical protein BAE46_10670 [Glaciecola punicea]
MIISRDKCTVFTFLLPVLASCAFYTGTAVASEKAKNVVLDTSNITLSGMSSGGYMATQFHFSHPELVAGVGVFAAGPYGCAQNSIMTALAQCIDKAPETYADKIKDISTTLGPSISQIKNDKVWLFHGALDTKISSKVASALQAQYAQLVAASNLAVVNNKPVAHLFPTLENGVDCEESASPYIGKCNFDGAGEMLSFILGPLQNPVDKNTAMQAGELITFEQNALANIDNTGMNEQSFVYLPNSCLDGKSCKVHISFHGCNQSIDNVGQQYATSTGLNEWAASNRLVILYPQIAKSSFMPMNPQACWDWWGYTGSDYLNKDGKQIAAVHKILLSLEAYLNR